MPQAYFFVLAMCTMQAHIQPLVRPEAVSCDLEAYTLWLPAASVVVGNTTINFFSLFNLLTLYRLIFLQITAVKKVHA